MIDQTIIEARKSSAPKLKEISENCESLTEALGELETAASSIELPSHQLLEEIRTGKEQLAELKERTEKRLKRFEAGLISVAVAGVEKSGKTQILQTLTGIKDLPTDISRCTAVPCEIIYDESQSAFNLEFHTEESFLREVLNALIQGFNHCLPAAQSGIRIPSEPSSVREFGMLKLPPLSSVAGGARPWILLDILAQIQTHLPQAQRFLGNPSLQGRPLSELKEWVARQNDGAAAVKVAAVRSCSIFTRFEGGSPNLRWIDTPGVDDPSPLARSRALRSVDENADLLVVATMPENKVAPSDAFVDFWSSISELRNEIDLFDRLQILLNQHTQSDPDGTSILRHKQELEKISIPGHLCRGPFKATDLADMRQFMDGVNAHLRSNLASQDAVIVEYLQNDFRSISAKIRTHVFDRARRIAPGDPSQAAVENQMFRRWFNKANPDGSQEGFWPNLRIRFQACVEKIPEDRRIEEAEVELKAIFERSVTELRATLPKEEDMANLRRQNAGDAPINVAMRVAIQKTYSDMINALSSHVREFGPIMQAIIVEILSESGLRPLLPEGDPQKALASLIHTLKEVAQDEATESVIAGLSDAARLQESLQYVFRYEMRPAVNIFNAMLWSEGKPWDGLVKLITVHVNQGSANETREFFERHKIPGIQNSDADHAKFFEEMNKHAVRGIKSVIESGRCRFATIADDVIRDCQYRLSFSDLSQQAWESLLDPLKSALLSNELASIRSQSQKLVAFSRALNNLGSILNQS